MGHVCNLSPLHPPTPSLDRGPVQQFCFQWLSPESARHAAINVSLASHRERLRATNPKFNATTAPGGVSRRRAPLTELSHRPPPLGFGRSHHPWHFIASRMYAPSQRNTIGAPVHTESAGDPSLM